MGLQGLQNLFEDELVGGPSSGKKSASYLKLNLSLGNVLLAAAATGNLLGLRNLGADSLYQGNQISINQWCRRKD